MLLVFGDREQDYLQARYVLLSLLGHWDDSPFRAVVVTDHPERFAWFGEDRLRCIAVDAETLRKWRGPRDIFWRIQQKAIAVVAASQDGALLYLDTDIAVKCDLAPLLSRLEEGERFLHLPEFPIGRPRRRSRKKMCRLALAGTWAGYKPVASDHMWNVGVTALPASELDLADRAVAILDEMIDATDGVPHTNVSQLAASLAMHSAGAVAEALPHFRHYWGNKPGWWPEIASRLDHIRSRGLGVEDAARYIRSHPIELPAIVRHWPFFITRRYMN